MAHIVDGVLSAPVLIAGGAAAAAGVAAGLRGLDDARILRAAILSAAFFTASLMMIPVGATSVHLLLSTLMGLAVGWAVFPAVLVGLTLQFMLFGVGGLTTLGVNTLNIALPGALAGLALRGLMGGLTGGEGASAPARAMAVAGLAAACAVAATTAMVAGALALSAPGFAAAAPFVALVNVPLMAVEAAVTAFAVGFLMKVKPELIAPETALPA
ncbi:MAG: cobalt transporter CbiM [Rubrimonas sp.]|uniref:cobalt transporter CbiM n=1 Tax=Rubrimonas sp. TaxID=2036015 RepID=UPI002FDD64E3